MNKQEVFDKVASHLLTQMKPSTEPDPGPETGLRGACYYRSPEGLKCAIGCLIPDELYDPKFEGKRVSILPIDILRYIGVETDEDLLFLRRLQKIHDEYSVELWKVKLKKFASYYDLQWNHGEV